jgi:PleD family two-component response regulator
LAAIISEHSNEVIDEDSLSGEDRQRRYGDIVFTEITSDNEEQKEIYQTSINSLPTKFLKDDSFRVLLAEDNQTHRVLLEYILIHEFKITNITFAKHGKEAKSILDKSLDGTLQPFDWIILDYDLQFLSGLQIMSWYRQKA